MMEFIQIEDIFITKAIKEENKTIIEVCFQNLHEPKYCRLYKATLVKETDWAIDSIAVYDATKEKFLSVGALYAPTLREEIKNKILLSIGQDSNYEQQIAL